MFTHLVVESWDISKIVFYSLSQTLKNGCGIHNLLENFSQVFVWIILALLLLYVRKALESRYRNNNLINVDVDSKLQASVPLGFYRVKNSKEKSLHFLMLLFVSTM